MSATIKIVTDATCRAQKPGYKGKAVGAANFYDKNGEEILVEDYNLGEMNAYGAECETVLRALDTASGLTRGRIEVWSDSEALVRHMNGIYRLRTNLSREYFDKLKTLEHRFEAVDYFHHDRATRLGRTAHLAADSAFSKIHSKGES